MRGIILEEEYPTLSLKERDRRWRKLRELMKKEKMDCLVVAGLRSREQLDRYITNDITGGFVIFPIEGEPILLFFSNDFITSHWESMRRGEQVWVSDVRVGPLREALVSVIKELDYDKSNIGVVGLGGLGREPEGWIPYHLWLVVEKNLPDANFRDVTREYCELAAIKSEEEIRLIKKSAEIGELACEEMIKRTKPGVAESEIYAAVMYVLFSHGASGGITPYTTPLILHSGPDNPSWGAPRWLFRAQPPPVLKAGDVLVAEIFTRYGGMETQQEQSIALKPVDPVNKKCAEIARKSYEAGVKALRSGVKFGEVANAMEAPLKEEKDVWHLTPLIHDVSPLGGFASALAVGMEGVKEFKKYKDVVSAPVRGADVTIKPGMVVVLEPNACVGTHRINIGGTCIITETGCLELNKLPTEMQVV